MKKAVPARQFAGKRKARLSSVWQHLGRASKQGQFYMNEIYDTTALQALAEEVDGASYFEEPNYHDSPCVKRGNAEVVKLKSCDTWDLWVKEARRNHEIVKTEATRTEAIEFLQTAGVR